MQSPSLSYWKPSFPQTVNEPTARTVAALVAVTAAALVLSQSFWFLAFLAYEFLARVLYGPRLSFMVTIAERLVLEPLKVDRRPVPGPPKRFAQFVGLLFSLAAAGAWIFTGEFTVSAWIIGVLFVFAALEAAIGFCAGCFVFGLAMKAGLVPREVCERCVY
jgi:hypothetical protein